MAKTARMTLPVCYGSHGAGQQGIQQFNLVYLIRLMQTLVTPACLKPNWFAAALDTSIILPPTKGPRSLMRTLTLLPLRRLVTRTTEPKGRERCAAVSLLGFMRSPFAVIEVNAYHDALPQLPAALAGFMVKMITAARTGNNREKVFNATRHVRWMVLLFMMFTSRFQDQYFQAGECSPNLAKMGKCRKHRQVFPEGSIQQLRRDGNGSGKGL